VQVLVNATFVMTNVVADNLEIGLGSNTVGWLHGFPDRASFANLINDIKAVDPNTAVQISANI
jgi:hypothetical protein